MSKKPTVQTEFIASCNNWEGAYCVKLSDYEKLERERDGWKEREAQAHRLLDIAERELAEARKALVSALGVGYDENGWQDLARVALDMYGRKP